MGRTYKEWLDELAALLAAQVERRWKEGDLVPYVVLCIPANNREWGKVDVTRQAVADSCKGVNGGWRPVTYRSQDLHLRPSMAIGLPLRERIRNVLRVAPIIADTDAEPPRAFLGGEPAPVPTKAEPATLATGQPIGSHPLTHIASDDPQKREAAKAFLSQPDSVVVICEHTTKQAALEF